MNKLIKKSFLFLLDFPVRHIENVIVPSLSRFPYFSSQRVPWGIPWRPLRQYHARMAAIRCSFRTACSPKFCRQLSGIISPFFRQQHTKSIEEYGSLNVSWRREILNGTIDFAMTEPVNQNDAFMPAVTQQNLRFWLHILANYSDTFFNHESNHPCFDIS